LKNFGLILSYKPKCVFYFIYRVVKKFLEFLKTICIFGIALLWAIYRYLCGPKRLEIGPSSGHFKNKKNWHHLGVKNFMTPQSPLGVTQD